jgi:light-regulated signal transduction histidine kinase (bacteriophytochrome)
LKEPLRTIGSFVGLIQRRHAHALPAEAVEYMTFVKDGVQRMDSLLSDLLEYSTLCAEDATTTEVTPLHRALRDVLGNLRETIRERGAIVELPLETPGLAIQRSHLVQLFQNLVSNAIKFSPENPHVVVGFQRDVDGSLLFAIKDQGIGIDKAYENKIFQVFHRLHRNKFEGTGIGLALCRNIVDKYSGQIWFESEPNQGTTFFRGNLKLFRPRVHAF